MPSKLGSFSVGCPTIFQHPTSTKSLCRDYQKVWPLGRCLIVLPKTFAMDRIKRGWLFMFFFFHKIMLIINVAATATNSFFSLIASTAITFMNMAI